MALIGRTWGLLAIVAALAAPANGQDFPPAHLGGPFSRVPVLNAPFSAEATTRVHEVFPDGTARSHTVIARYYRDSQGQVRAEVDTPWGPYVVVASFGPEREEDVLDPTKRTYRIAGAIGARLFNGESGVAVPLGKVCFEYPPRVVAGVSDAERLRAVNAQVSPELGIVTASQRADEWVPGLGIVPVSQRSDEFPSVDAKARSIRRSADYELTNIRREEPPAQLFQVPTDYTFVSIVGSGEDPLVEFAPWQSPPGCKPLKR